MFQLIGRVKVSPLVGLRKLRGLVAKIHGTWAIQWQPGTANELGQPGKANGPGQPGQANVLGEAISAARNENQMQLAGGHMLALACLA